MKKIICFLFSFLLLNTMLATASPGDVQALVKSKLDAAIVVLQTEKLSDHDRKEKVTNIIIPIFDMTLMAKLSVGKKHWSGFSDAQKEKFVAAFNHRLQNSYLSTIMKYTDEEIVYKTAVQDKKKVYIPLSLVSTDGKIGMVYKLYQTKDTWKIYDVEIEGVSIIKSYRSQISEILEKSSFEELLKKFEQSSP